MMAFVFAGTGTSSVKISSKAGFFTLCGRVFSNTDAVYFPRTKYLGRTNHFCTDNCLTAFLADPHLFYRTHRSSRQSLKFPD
jgi:YHS domain-containing protein